MAGTSQVQNQTPDPLSPLPNTEPCSSRTFPHLSNHFLDPKPPSLHLFFHLHPHPHHELQVLPSNTRQLVPPSPLAPIQGPSALPRPGTSAVWSQPVSPLILCRWDSLQVTQKVPRHHSSLGNTGLDCLISCFPFTLFSHRNREVSYFYMPIFSDKIHGRLLTANPAPSCKTCTCMYVPTNLPRAPKWQEI